MSTDCPTTEDVCSSAKPLEDSVAAYIASMRLVAHGIQAHTAS